jgi:tellurium resistance protein TerZ
MSRPPLSGLTITITILEGRKLVAKDRNLLGQRTTSDTYVKVFQNEAALGKTKTIPKTLNPKWNSENTFAVTVGADSAQDLMRQNGGLSFTLNLFDEDRIGTDDSMGTVVVPVHPQDNDDTKWYSVSTGSGINYCKNAKGQLQVRVSIQAQAMRQVARGQQTRLTSNIIQVGLAWDVEQGREIDLDSSCVAVGWQGQVLLDETVYYGNLTNSNLSIQHSGDETTGEAVGDDEKILLELDKIPIKVMALYFLLTVANNRDHANLTFADVRSAQARVIDTETRQGICCIVPTDFGANTALFLLRLSRVQGDRGWLMTPIEEGNPDARDFGTLIPEIQGYTRDLVSDIFVVNPQERIAVMRKGGTIRVSDYVPGGFLPRNVTFGLAWDVTDGVSIDLDASAILLDENYQLVDLVFFRNLISNDGSIRHSGDEREGDQDGDDEMINLALGDVSPKIKYIGFVVNSYSKQELDDVAEAKCHLFDPKTKADIATYTMTNSKELDKHTALLMGCLYRGDGGRHGGRDDWFLNIIGTPHQGTMAKDNVGDLQNYLMENPPQTPNAVPEAEIILTAMPDAELLDEEEIVYVPQSDYKQYEDQEIVVPPARV